MAKKRRRSRRAKRRARRRAAQRSQKQQLRCNNHHLLWQRKRWSKGFWASKLRSNDYFIVQIPADHTHRLIHEMIPHIPVLPEEYAEMAYVAFTELRGHKLDRVVPPWERLDVLIDILDGIPEVEKTVECLKLERAILRKLEGRS